MALIKKIPDGYHMLVGESTGGYYLCHRQYIICRYLFENKYHPGFHIYPPRKFVSDISYKSQDNPVDFHKLLVVGLAGADTMDHVLKNHIKEALLELSRNI